MTTRGKIGAAILAASVPIGLLLGVPALIGQMGGGIQVTNPSSGGGGSGTAARANAFDCDFTAAAHQALPTVDGGTVTACTYTNGTGPITWTAVAANFATGTNQINNGFIMNCTGTGLSGLPSVAYGFYTSLAAAIPGFNSRTPFTITAWIKNPTTVGSTTSQYETVAIDNFPLSTNSGVAESGSIFYRSLSAWTVQDEKSGSSSSYADSTIGSGTNVLTMDFPNGLETAIHSYQVSVYDGGFPVIGGEIPLAWQGMNTTATSMITQGPSNFFNLFLNCNGTTGTNTDFGRVRLDYTTGG